MTYNVFGGTLYLTQLQHGCASILYIGLFVCFHVCVCRLVL